MQNKIGLYCHKFRIDITTVFTAHVIISEDDGTGTSSPSYYSNSNGQNLGFGSIYSWSGWRNSYNQLGWDHVLPQVMLSCLISDILFQQLLYEMVANPGTIVSLLERF